METNPRVAVTSPYGVISGHRYSHFASVIARAWKGISFIVSSNGRKRPDLWGM